MTYSMDHQWRLGQSIPFFKVVLVQGGESWPLDYYNNNPGSNHATLHWNDFIFDLKYILYLKNLGFNLPKNPYGPFFWLFIIVTLVLIIAVNVGRYQNCLEEPIGISSRLTPKSLESTFLNFILVLVYGLSVAPYHLYWKKYVQI